MRKLRIGHGAHAQYAQYPENDPAPDFYAKMPEDECIENNIRAPKLVARE